MGGLEPEKVSMKPDELKKRAIEAQRVPKTENFRPGAHGVIGEKGIEAESARGNEAGTRAIADEEFENEQLRIKSRPDGLGADLLDK